jgi:hypothetical protein
MSKYQGSIYMKIKKDGGKEKSLSLRKNKVNSV